MIATNTTLSALTLVSSRDSARVDSRLLAVNMQKAHANLFELVKDHRADFEQLGNLRFETGVIAGRGQPEKFALLNEDQSFLLLTYTRNTVRTRELKIKLVKAFGEARRAAETGTEYLPTYHALHDEIRTLAAGSINERFVHMNLNKLLNKTVGVGAGQRHRLSQAPKALLIVAQAVAAQAMRGAADHRQGYERAKLAMAPLAQLSIGGAA